MEVGYCGDGGTDGEGLIGIWGAVDGGAFIRLLGTHYVVHKRIMTSSGEESATGAGKVGTAGKDLGEIRVG